MHKRTPRYKSPQKYSEKKLNSRKSTKRDIIQSQTSASGPLEDCQPSADTSSPSLKSTTSGDVANKSYSLRQRMKQELSCLSDLQLDSDPEDSDENNSDYESDYEEAPILDEDAIEKRGKNAKTFSETYFRAQKQQKKASTSNRTLSGLKLERTDMEQLLSILGRDNNHAKEKEAMFRRYKSQFAKWNFLLHQGFNVLLYGVGSKRELLNSFCEECLDGSLYVVVHGFFPSLNFKQILTSVTEEGLGSDRKFSNIQEHAAFIQEYFTEGKEELYLVIHNMDGVALRKAQQLLSSLASVPNIHLVCSIDHINSPLMWDQLMLSHLRWVWVEASTFEPYVVETSYESIFRQQSSHLLLSSLLHVFRSLTPNGRGVFAVLARHQAQHKTGLRFHEWYGDCREAFLVNSEITMQAQLSEFKNHKLLSSKKSVEGADVWFIPVDAITLEQFLESCK